MSQEYYSHGKLLLSGEYAVLDGALCLALPTIAGQFLSSKAGKTPRLLWTSLDEKGKIWFRAQFEVEGETVSLRTGKQDGLSGFLIRLLQAARQLNPDFLKEKEGWEITTRLEFPRNWGLGSSSTLISNTAYWAGVDAFELHDLCLPGSGYDVACARSKGPILYQLWEDSRRIKAVPFNPPFREQLFFVYLNRKQDSREGIHRYTLNKGDVYPLIREISEISESLILCRELQEFETLINRHESLIATCMGDVPIKARLFADFPGAIKSLGAWGGDFILACGDGASQDYFRAKGFETIVPYERMILNSLSKEI